MTPEDIGDIFQELEDNLFALAIRNIKRHENWEEAEGFKWTQWQAEQIAGLREYRKNVQVLTDYHFDKAKDAIKEYLKEAYDESVDDAENTARRLLGRFGLNGQMSQNFFGVNSNKLDIIINEAVQNVDTKRYAAINRMNSGYTDFLRRADMFAQSGSYTIPQAVDMASKDFLAAGLNCVEYSNGNRVNIASYTEMALRTSSAEVTRQANGDVRDEFGEYLVVSNVIGMTCPYCQKWQGRVMIDDVYSSGQPDGKHPTVSEAKADHFLHPNCRHQLYMYIEGVTEIAELPNDVETKEHYKAEQKQRYYEREIRKYKRLRDGAVDPTDRQMYDARVKEWTAKHNKFLEEHDYLRKNPKRLAQGYRGNGKPEGPPHVAIYGALNDINDPLHERRDKQAEDMYTQIKNRKKDGVIKNIAKSANVDVQTATKAYEHVFEDLHELDGELRTFPPDYDMAQSLQRLASCSKVQEHDVILVLHEAMERDIMQSQGLSYEKAHRITEQKYNYHSALMKWKEKNGYA